MAIASEIWLYSLLSVFAVSMVSLVGVMTLSMTVDKLKNILIYLVSFAAGALFGDVFIHLLPEIAEEASFTLQTSLSILSGIVIFFILEKGVQWHHYHLPHTKEEAHPFAIINLIGDALHNFIDGLIIGASYLASLPIGIATTIAVVFHEIPQEIGDFGVLLHGGFSKKKALFFNFMTALTAVLGAIVALVLASYVENLTNYLVPLAAGAFIYIAGSDLIPELHRESKKPSSSFWQFVAFILGIGMMASLLLLE